MTIQYEYNVEEEADAVPVCVTISHGRYTLEFLEQLATFEQCVVVDYRGLDSGLSPMKPVKYIYPIEETSV